MKQARRQENSTSGLAFSVLISIILVSGITSCRNSGMQQTGSRKKTPMVETVMVKERTLASRIDLTGSIEPTRLARMASPVEGPVMACPVREGDHVRAGQILAKLGRAKGDDASAASARADLDREELEEKRIEKLVQAGAVPGEELDRARVSVSRARAALARATERLGDYQVRAPWAGIVLSVPVAVGDFVPSMATLIEMFDPRSLVLRFAVPEDKAAVVGHDAAVKVFLDAYPGQNFDARVVRIYPDINRQTHTRTLEAEIDSDIKLFPGMFARLDVTLKTVPDTLCVPVEAVVRRDGKTLVFVIGDDATVEQRPVELGLEDDGYVQILAGVNQGEAVAIAGHNRLRDGKQVREAKGQGSEKKQKPDRSKGRNQ